MLVVKVRSNGWGLAAACCLPRERGLCGRGKTATTLSLTKYSRPSEKPLLWWQSCTILSPQNFRLESVRLSDAPFSAGESALGYLYQCRVALLFAVRRLKSPDEFELSIESLDDVTFSSGGVAEELLQTKHHLKSKANLTNASPDLWKTIRVWASQLDALKTGTRLQLLTTVEASAGSVAALLRENAQRDTPTALKILLEVAATSTNTANADAYSAFTALSTEEQLPLIDSITIIDNSPDIIRARSEIENELRPGIRREHLKVFVDRLEGWWYQRVIRNLASKDDGVILSKELHSELNDLREQFDLDENLPIDLKNVFPTEDVIKAMLGRPFVEQLRIIALTERRVQHAIIDYYRAAEQRSRWVREDLLLVGDLEEYEQTLVDEWERAFERIVQTVELADEPEKQVAGRAVYDWARETALYIRPQCRESYIHRGSFQLLADKLRVGWHPEFYDRLEHLLTTPGGRS